MLRVIAAYLLAVLLAYTLGAVAATQSVLGSLARMGVSVDLATRLQTTAQDLLGMAGSYAPIIAIAFALALPVAALLARFLPDWRMTLYVAAAAVGIVAAHLIMRQLLDLTPIAATRSVAGLLIQSAAGACGGYVCVLMLRRKGR